jgi:hypothetical protein
MFIIIIFFSVIISFISMTIDAFITINQPGHDVKIMQSNASPRLKSSNLDSLATEQIIGISSNILSIFLSKYPSISIFLSCIYLYLPIYPCIYSIHLCTRVSIYLMYLSTRVSIYLMYLSVYLSINLSIYLPI